MPTITEVKDPRMKYCQSREKHCVCLKCAKFKKCRPCIECIYPSLSPKDRDMDCYKEHKGNNGIINLDFFSNYGNIFSNE